MSEPMPTIPTQSPFTYPIPNPSASLSSLKIMINQINLSSINCCTTFSTESNLLRPTRLQGNQSIKRLGKDAKGNTIVHPPVSLDEHVAVQRENKVRTLLLQALPEDHMPDFHHYDDARDIWMAFTEFSVKEEEGLHKGYDRFQKILSKLNQVQARPENDDINLKFLRALPSSCYGVKAVLLFFSHPFAFHWSCQLGFKDLLILISSNLDMVYEDFARFKKKAGRKMNYNNKQPARFDRRKVRCYKCLQLGHFARECNVKTVDDKARYSAFKVTEVKTDEPKKGIWGDVDFSDNGGAGVSDAAAEFAMMGISPKAYQNAVKTLESQKDWYHKTQIALEEKIRYDDELARFEKWKESSKNLNKLINSSMSTRTKIGLGFKEYFGEDEVFDLSRPSTMYPEPVEEEVKPLYSRFVKAGEMHAVPPSITGTYMPIPYKSDIKETQSSIGDLLHTVIQDLKTKDKELPTCVDIKTFCQNSVPCKSKAASVPAGSRNSSASVTAGGSDPAASRNRPAVNSLVGPNPTVGLDRQHHRAGDPSTDNDIGIVDSGCLRSMTGNKEKLDNFVQERITKKRRKNEAKSTKPDSEWKSRKKTKSKSKPKCRKKKRKKRGETAKLYPKGQNCQGPIPINYKDLGLATPLISPWGS
ncbi:ribonuclease H-like domain-containing protein [Tanacetum coccineum]